MKVAEDSALLGTEEERVSSACLALGGSDCGALGRGAVLGGFGGFTDVWGALMCREFRRKASWLGDRFSLCAVVSSSSESLLHRW